jgi:hypothetical protein
MFWLSPIGGNLERYFCEALISLSVNPYQI